MKNLATYRNDICLIAGTGLFVNEVANYLKFKNLLGQIIIINENKTLKKNFKYQYKQFDLAAIFQGEADVQYYGQFELWNPDFGGVVTWKKWINESVTNNPSGTFPRAGSTTSSYRYQNDFFLYDRDYLRLKNLQIGYNIPTDSLPIDGLRLFFNATNLLTFTSIPLVDPEQRSGAATLADPNL